MLKALNPLRKSNKHHRSTSSGSNISPCNIPPLLIIKAIGDYHARRVEELSFFQGDFFHVIGSENSSTFYQVCNPLNNKVGLVPVSLFEIIEKKPRSSSNASEHKNTNSTFNKPLRSNPPPNISTNSSLMRPTSIIYAKALYTFKAERNDELGFEQGDQLIVLARSTDDWFVAQPLIKKCDPGLVPVAYLQLCDPSNGDVIPDLDAFLRRRQTKLPSVYEWKAKSLASQTVSVHSIPSLASNSPSSCTSSYMAMPTTPIESIIMDYASSATPNNLPLDTAHVTSFIADEGKFTFIVQLRFEGLRVQRTLYRDYEDFHQFHLTMMSQFPKEAGQTGERRILPFMPGPLEMIDEKVTIQRRIDLDLYVQQLFLLPQHLQITELFRSFFRMRRRDFESSIGDDPKPKPTFRETIQAQNGTKGTAISKDLKVKVNYNGEIFAFKLDKGATNFDLHNKVCQRIGDRFETLSYRTEDGILKLMELHTNVDSISTTQSGKLMLYAS